MHIYVGTGIVCKSNKEITHGLCDGDVTAGFLQVQQDSKTRGHKYSLFKRHPNLNMRKFSFTNRVVDQWNNLADSVVQAETVRSFETKLDKVWKESKVMYVHDCDVKLLTSSRNLRYTSPCAQPAVFWWLPIFIVMFASIWVFNVTISIAVFVKKRQLKSISTEAGRWL